MTHLWTELAIVEQRALRRGPRMRGLRGYVPAQINQVARVSDWIVWNPQLASLRDRFIDQEIVGISSAGVNGNGYTFRSGATGATITVFPTSPIRFYADDGPATPFDPEAGLPWLQRATITNGLIGNDWFVGFSVGAVALVAGGLYYWRKRR